MQWRPIETMPTNELVLVSNGDDLWIAGKDDQGSWATTDDFAFSGTLRTFYPESLGLTDWHPAPDLPGRK